MFSGMELCLEESKPSDKFRSISPAIFARKASDYKSHLFPSAKVFALLTILTLPFLSFSQSSIPNRSEREKLSSELLGRAPYIFAGRVGQGRFIYDDRKDKIFTSYPITILKVFKGKVSEKIITFHKDTFDLLCLRRDSWV